MAISLQKPSGSRIDRSYTSFCTRQSPSCKSGPLRPVAPAFFSLPPPLPLPELRHPRPPPPPLPARRRDGIGLGPGRGLIGAPQVASRHASGCVRSIDSEAHLDSAPLPSQVSLSRKEVESVLPVKSPVPFGSPLALRQLAPTRVSRGSASNCDHCVAERFVTCSMYLIERTPMQGEYHGSSSSIV